MTIISPFICIGNFIKMLAIEYFWSSVFVISCFLVYCVYYICKHGNDPRQHMTMVFYMVILLLLSLLFSFTALRDEQNNYSDTYESFSSPVSYDIIKKENIIYVYEKF